MKKTYLIVCIISLVLTAGIITAGCVQSTTNIQGQQPGNTAPIIQGTEQPRTPTDQAGSYFQHYNNSTMNNDQRPQMDLASAASKLGVTEQQLSDALGIGNPTQGHRWNITDSAKKLGVTEQQLRDALGMPAGGRIRSDSYNATQTPWQ